MASNDIKIDKGIELPPNSGGRPRKYPWRDMEIGDSFFIPQKRYSGLFTGARNAGIKIRTRQMNENGVDGIRVWRVE